MNTPDTLVPQSAAPASDQVAALANAVADRLLAPDSPFALRLASLIAAAITEKTPRVVAPRLLSFRAAARLLGIDRGSTLPQLVADGCIRTIVVAGRARIPFSEVERIEHEGLRPRRPGGKRRAPGFAEAPDAAEEVAKFLRAREARRLVAKDPDRGR